MSVLSSPSVVLGLVAALSADAGVQTLVGAGVDPYSFGVYDYELPTAADVAMPGEAIVIRRHPGVSGPATLQLNYSRIQVLAFGSTPSLADQVYWAAYLVLKGLQSAVWASTYIHNCIQTSGAGPNRDPTLQWPYNISMWLVKASDLSV